MADDSDPFGPFRRLFEQFDPSGSAGVSPGIGMPPSPMAMLGAGMGGGNLSPEETTKRTVRQLYGALAGLSGGASGSSMLDAWEQYAEMFDIDTSLSAAPEQVTAATMTTYQLWLHSLSQVLVESYTMRLVAEEVVSDEYRRSTQTQQWLWSLPQSDREQLLLRCTDIDEELVTEMEAARQRRDELLYDFGSWGDTELEQSLEDAQRYLRVLTALDDKVNEGSPFSYFPDENVFAGMAPDSDQQTTQAKAETDAAETAASSTSETETAETETEQPERAETETEGDDTDLSEAEREQTDAQAALDAVETRDENDDGTDESNDS